jgi:hypothetical protein
MFMNIDWVRTFKETDNLIILVVAKCQKLENNNELYVGKHLAVEGLSGLSKLLFRERGSPRKPSLVVIDDSGNAALYFSDASLEHLSLFVSK